MAKSLIAYTDETIDILGNYFVRYNIHQEYGLTFEMFVDRWARGIIEL